MNEEKFVYVVTRITTFDNPSLDTDETLYGVFTNSFDAIDFVADATKRVLENFKRTWPNACVTDGLTVVVPKSHWTYFYIECVKLDNPIVEWL